eukprot:91107_1
MDQLYIGTANINSKQAQYIRGHRTKLLELQKQYQIYRIITITGTKQFSKPYFYRAEYTLDASYQPTILRDIEFEVGTIRDVLNNTQIHFFRAMCVIYIGLEGYCKIFCEEA